MIPRGDAPDVIECILLVDHYADAKTLVRPFQLLVEAHIIANNAQARAHEQAQAPAQAHAHAQAQTQAQTQQPQLQITTHQQTHPSTNIPDKNNAADECTKANEHTTSHNNNNNTNNTNNTNTNTNNNNATNIADKYDKPLRLPFNDWPISVRPFEGVHLPALSFTLSTSLVVPMVRSGGSFPLGNMRVCARLSVSPPVVHAHEPMTIKVITPFRKSKFHKTNTARAVFH